MNKNYVIITKAVAVTVLVGVLALAVWGIILIFDHENLMGIVPISIAVVVSLAQIIAGIVLYKKNH